MPPRIRIASGIHLLFITLIAFVGMAGSELAAEEPSIPEPLLPWKDWVMWDKKHGNCPTIYSAADQPICFWPSTLNLSVNDSGGSFSATIDVFEESWVPLPGSEEVWPVKVRSGDKALVVVKQDGRPSVKLPPGQVSLSGEFRWNTMPQRITVPQSIGILSLSIQGAQVPTPTWDPGGQVWLRRTASGVAGKNSMGVKVYRRIEDGIPVWLRTQIELTVSGKSREESLGFALPFDWQLSTVESEIPVAVDDRGFVKAQVRPGKWTISLSAFRTTDPSVIEYAADTPPMVGSEWVGLKTDTEFRAATIEDLLMVDATQTTYPEPWRGTGIYVWDTSKPFRLVEKMRGMGDQAAEGLEIHRRLWLDEDGVGVTYQDHLKGKRQEIWRLDVAQAHQLGHVRIDDQPQLITENPSTGASGVEVRSRDLKMQAIGRLDRSDQFAATGWQTDADALRLTLTLPPGWRALAVLGADSVAGDWLTAWTLFDLFLLLIFALAVFRLYGVVPGVIALLAFGLAYHEPYAPRFTWLLLLIPLALLKVVEKGALKPWIVAWKNVAIAVLLLCLIPFIVLQTQSVLYPQLETTGVTYGSRGIFAWPHFDFSSTSPNGFSKSGSLSRYEPAVSEGRQMKQIGLATHANLTYDPSARIQTGPAEPKWNWNNVDCRWSGPVTSEQVVRPVLLSLTRNRILTVLRLALLILLSVILFGVRKIRWPFPRQTSGVAAGALILLMLPSSGSAQMPDEAMLGMLRQRLTETPEVYPNAAEIPSADLSIVEDRLEMQVTVHAAIDVAVPLPGRLPAWSPVSVLLDGRSDGVIVCRRDEYLWILVPKGVHEVEVKGLLPKQANWEWTFLLKPHYVTVEAEGWKVTGINPNGTPDGQVFFVKEQEVTGDKAAYDQSHFNTIVEVKRELELGLVWKVRTTVKRLSESGKAISLEVPLLQGEKVLSSSRNIEAGKIAVRLAATQSQTAWNSELPIRSEILMTASESISWVESWQLTTSAMWSVSLSGLRPVFQSNGNNLIPVWHPWPSESVQLRLSKPIPIIGETMTVHRVNHETMLGDRRRTNDLSIELESSLASDFSMTLDPTAEISQLAVDGQSIPRQRDGSTLVVPVHPGKQTVTLQWRTNEAIKTVVRKTPITLPTEASNITTTMNLPKNRWILWADGPLQGPAVRFWTVLVVAMLAALALGSLSLSPLGRWEWGLLFLGLTQVHLIPALIVVGWLFLLAWRGLQADRLGRWRFNLVQLFLPIASFAALVILLFAVAAGLLGNPEMFILGSGSSGNHLTWFEPRTAAALPVPYVVSVSVWFYRLMMLFWALWLASALLRWLNWGWQQYSQGGLWRPKVRNPPPLATPQSRIP
ncbi:hypothetical protein [Novipirellula artificiosorum]|uniref:Uncharacterized protein n=1 Tax=Novipirellula artificiosorum TaxID=2528016 RepID=A0A5C6D308_9BACT|nr:hypothetical protein [Novipirellula artificiosorum]TWU31322.1 hypothetical protein Poly41_61910 [Novipirellula artificiosorum]